MLADPQAVRTMKSASRARREPGSDLIAALTALAGGMGELLRHSERAWASITFLGARHCLTLAFAGTEAISAGERFIEALPEHEFAIPGQLVADAGVISMVHEALPEPKLTVDVELLLLEDA